MMSDEVEEGKDKEEDAAADWGDALSEQADGEAEAGADADWGDALSEQADSEADDKKQEEEKNYESAEMQNLQADSDVTVDDVNLDVILEIPVTLSMEIGRTEISIRNLLQLNQGSVVELDRLAGEPMDVMVNGTLVAHGEVVVVNEKFGIRLTDIISPQERVKKLR
ncbi:MAG: flagellar motor switch protein FliN [Gammaproteobacteria bacterium]|nr:flagellar motor switch protein FliN [Gammaproteobacteria bacterium]